MFGLWRKSKEPAEKKIAVENQDTEIEENISFVAEKSRSAADRASSQAKDRMQEAAREELQELRMIEDGRCPRCGRKVDMFLYTSICRFCGWNTFITPQQDGIVLNLKSGNSFQCDRIYQSQTNEVLCLKNQVVVARVPKESVDYVNYVWSGQELAEKEAKFQTEHSGVCAWCQKKIAPQPTDGSVGMNSGTLRRLLKEKSNGNGTNGTRTNGHETAVAAASAKTEPVVLYAAFGAYQEKFSFCCEKCLERFQHHYPTRVHRNCYEMECADCDQCIKKLDVPKGKGNYSRLLLEAAK